MFDNTVANANLRGSLDTGIDSACFISHTYIIPKSPEDFNYIAISTQGFSLVAAESSFFRSSSLREILCLSIKAVFSPIRISR